MIAASTEWEWKLLCICNKLYPQPQQDVDTMLRLEVLPSD